MIKKPVDLTSPGTQTPARPPVSPGTAGALPKQRGPAGCTVIRDALIPACMQLAGATPDIDGATFRAYRDALVLGAGSKDVLEQTLLEQVALAHVATARIYAHIGTASTAEAAGIYAAAAARLAGEIRRTIVAIREMRSPPPQPNITLNARQEVHVGQKADAADTADTAKKTGGQSELGGNCETGANRMRQILGEGLGGPAEPEVARTAD